MAHSKHSQSSTDCHIPQLHSLCRVIGADAQPTRDPSKIMEPTIYKIKTNGTENDTSDFPNELNGSALLRKAKRREEEKTPSLMSEDVDSYDIAINNRKLGVKFHGKKDSKCHMWAPFTDNVFAAILPLARRNSMLRANMMRNIRYGI